MHTKMTAVLTAADDFAALEGYLHDPITGAARISDRLDEFGILDLTRRRLLIDCEVNDEKDEQHRDEQQNSCVLDCRVAAQVKVVPTLCAISSHMSRF